MEEYNHNEQDPAQILLRAFYHNLNNLGQNRHDSYRNAKNDHPIEFAAVSERARNTGHQGGVVGDTSNGRHELILKGHHNHTQCGVCIGWGGIVTCIVMRYRTHNFPGLFRGFFYGGAGAEIRRAWRMGLRILRNQRWNMWNLALFHSIGQHRDIRCYVYRWSHSTYEYAGLFRVMGFREIFTEQNFRCFEFFMLPAPEADHQLLPIIPQAEQLGDHQLLPIIPQAEQFSEDELEDGEADEEEIEAEFNNYLAFILSAQSKTVEVRQAAGLLLKNNLKNAYTAMPLANQEFIKSKLLPCLGDGDKQIRSTAGTIISVLVQLGGVISWPELLNTLVKCLDSNDLNHMEGAMDALSKICEDIPQVLDSETPGSSESPIHIFLPRLFQLFQSPHASLRKLSLGSVNQYIMLMPSALYMSMDKFLHGLFSLANDPNGEVRKLVCAAFVQLIEVHPAFLEPHLRNVIEYMLQVNNDPDDEVSLEACEFWSTYCEAQLPPDYIKEFLPLLIPALLSNMAYDDDESLSEAEEDGSLPDRDQDLKPRFYSSRLPGSENVEDDDDDMVKIWNLRKCSAAALHSVSNVFGDEILPMLMPYVQSKLSTSSDETWKEREAAVLALGTIADGCINGLYPHLSQIVAFLIPLLDDKFPLIRSISCWTLSRFSKFIVEGINHPEGHKQFDEVLMGLLRKILDHNKRVQEAACSAFTTLEEKAAKELAPRLDVILQHLVWALGKYQRRNLRIVYDAIGTLANAVGRELSQPVHLDVLMPPLIAMWQQLSDADKDLFPLLECFTSIAQALGTGFSQFIQPVFQRCINIIQTQQLAKVDASAGIQYDKDFIVCSLDSLSGLTEGLGSGIESLVSDSNLRDLLLQCCMDDASDIRLSAFALLGNLARVCPIHLHPRLSEFLDIAAKQLSTPKLKENVFVANNACWAIEELAIKEIMSEELRNEVCQVLLGYKQMHMDGAWKQGMSFSEPP